MTGQSMRRKLQIAALALLAFPLSAPLAAQPGTASHAPSAPLPPEVVDLRVQDTRVLELGYRLVTANARFCPPGGPRSRQS